MASAGAPAYNRGEGAKPLFPGQEFGGGEVPLKLKLSYGSRIAENPALEKYAYI